MQLLPESGDVFLFEGPAFHFSLHDEADLAEVVVQHLEHFTDNKMASNV